MKTSVPVPVNIESHSFYSHSFINSLTVVQLICSIWSSRAFFVDLFSSFLVISLSVNPRTICPWQTIELDLARMEPVQLPEWNYFPLFAIHICWTAEKIAKDLCVWGRTNAVPPANLGSPNFRSALDSHNGLQNSFGYSQWKLSKVAVKSWKYLLE